MFMAKQVNSVSPGQFGGNMEDDIFECIFVNENVLIAIKISLKFVPKCPIYHKSALVHWQHICRRRGRRVNARVCDRLVTCIALSSSNPVQWNLFVTTISRIKFIAGDLFSNVF